MKHIFLSLCILAGTMTLSAQNLREHKKAVKESAKLKTAIISMDTFFVSGVAQARVRSEVRNFNITDYVFFNWDGREILQAKGEVWQSYYANYYSFTFPQSGNKAEAKANRVELPKLIADYQLIKNGAIDPTAESQFVNKMGLGLTQKRAEAAAKDSTKTDPGTFTKLDEIEQKLDNIFTGESKTPEQKQQSEAYESRLVKRNRFANVNVMHNFIEQDSRNVATFDQTNTTAPNGAQLLVVRFFLPDGTQIAEARAEDAPNYLNWNVLSFKDNQAYIVKCTDHGEHIKAIAKYLINRYYM